MKISNIIFSVLLLCLCIVVILTITNFGHAYSASFGRTDTTMYRRPVFEYRGVSAPKIRFSTRRIVGVPLKPLSSPLVKPDKEFSLKPPPFLLYKTDHLSKMGDQGKCGCCWAFATLSSLADRAVIKTGRPESLSVQQVLSCFDKKGCFGQIPEDLLRWAVKEKINLSYESSFQYEQKDSTVVKSSCRRSEKGVIVTGVKALTEFVEENQSLTESEQRTLDRNVENMKSELNEYGPFVAAMSIRQDFFDFTGGLYKARNSEIEGGHAIEIIGYSDPSSLRGARSKGADQRYWICRNSWGKSWGSRGFFAIPMGTNSCGIESMCVSGTVSHPSSPSHKRSQREILELLRRRRFESLGEARRYLPWLP